MEYKWLIRIIFALKKQFKSHDSSDQKVHKYVYRRGQNAETGNLAASKEKHEKLGYNHKNSDERSLDQASWWNGVLDSRYLTLQCISGRMNISPRVISFLSRMPSRDRHRLSATYACPPANVPPVKSMITLLKVSP